MDKFMPWTWRLIANAVADIGPHLVLPNMTEEVSRNAKVARLFQRHLRFTDITPKILSIQMFDLAPVDDIQIRILPIKLLNEVS